MRVIKMGDRTGPLAFLDMSGRTRPRGVHGSLFRIGDRAAAHLWLLNWRKYHPEHHILIIDDPFLPSAHGAFTLDPQWVFEGIADELWITERAQEQVTIPSGYVLYHANLWRIWYWLRHHRDVTPSIRPPAQALQRAEQVLKKHFVPPRFVSIQPLFDAGYNFHRNAPVSWWRGGIEAVSKEFPVVVLGTAQNAQDFSGRNIYNLCHENLSPMESLAVISMASTHVGGETGLTLWAAMMHVPVVATYNRWSEAKEQHGDCRPISFDQPVLFFPLNGDSAGLLKRIRSLSCFPYKVPTTRRSTVSAVGV